MLVALAFTCAPLALAEQAQGVEKPGAGGNHQAAHQQNPPSAEDHDRHAARDEEHREQALQDERISALAARDQAASASRANRLSEEGLRWNRISVYGAVGSLCLAFIAVAVSALSLRVTRKIGQAQVRCYISLIDGTLTPLLENRFRVGVRVQNSGQSPAIDVNLSTKSFSILGREADGSYQTFNVEFSDLGGNRDLAAGQNVECSAGWGTYPATLHFRDSPAFLLSMTLAMSWTDVFQRRGSATYRLSGSLRHSQDRDPVELRVSGSPERRRDD